MRVHAEITRQYLQRAKEPRTHACTRTAADSLPSRGGAFAPRLRALAMSKMLLISSAGPTTRAAALSEEEEEEDGMAMVAPGRL